MITSSMHSVSPYLTKSLSDFRSQLDKTEPVENKSKVSNAEALIAAPPNESGSDFLQEIDLTESASNTQDRRDSARQVAAQASEIKQTQVLVDTYIKASSPADETASSASTIDPAKIYNTSLKYSRRADLMSAFEDAVKPKESGNTINLLV